jgi:hypothetical protein
MSLVEYIINSRKDLLSDEHIKANIEDSLYEICEREHASCNSQCPIYNHDNSHLELTDERLSIKSQLRHILSETDVKVAVTNYVKENHKYEQEMVINNILTIINKILEVYPEEVAIIRKHSATITQGTLTSSAIKHIAEAEKGNLYYVYKAMNCPYFKSGKAMLEKLIK